MDRPGKHGQERRCALTRAVLPTARLIRFVADPAGTITPDLKRALPGRGVWIEARHAAIAQATRKSIFARALKRPVSVPPDLADRVQDLLRVRALAALSLANKAGSIVTGFDAVAEALGGDTVAVLLHGSDAAVDGCRKLDRKARATTTAITEFTIDELSLALGRLNVVHAAGLKSPATDAFMATVDRLMRYRQEPDGIQGSGGTGPGHHAVATTEARPDVR